jgi:tetratricopeptide (TPR) repeat protein
MKRVRVSMSILALLAICALVGSTSGCNYAKMVLGKDKLNQGVLLYNQGRNREAKEFFKSATEYMPDRAAPWLFYGAALSKDYKNLSGEERDKSAQGAIDVFKKALELAKGDCKLEENAMAYLSSIYDDLGKEDDWREWMTKRAENQCANSQLKATVYHSIAVKYWQCAYDQTTRYADKAQLAADPFHYRNLDYSEESRADKAKVEACIAKGMENVEKAIAVDPEYSDVLYYKGLLYREKQKMTKVEADRKKFEEEAKKIAAQAEAITKKKEAEKAAAATPSPTK